MVGGTWPVSCKSAHLCSRDLQNDVLNFCLGDVHMSVITQAEAPIPWPPDAKSQLTGKDPDARKGWGQEETGTTQDEMVGWHHWLNGHGLEQTPGDSEGQGSLACYSPWGPKELDTT